MLRNLLVADVVVTALAALTWFEVRAVRRRRAKTAQASTGA